MADRRSRWLRAKWSKDPNCHYCKRETVFEERYLEDEAQTDAMATCDHFIPLGKGGMDRPHNWRLCCRRCNEDKGDQWPEIWLGEADLDWTPEAPKPFNPFAAIFSTKA